MTETTYRRRFIDGLADTVSNHTLEQVLYRNFQALGVPAYTAEELDFAGRLSGTYAPGPAAPGIGSRYDAGYAAQAETLRREAGGAMNRFLLPLYEGDAFQPGSTDVGDVSWLCPTAQIHVAAWPNGSPGHSWQNVSCGRTAIGHKAALHAGKVLAARRHRPSGRCRPCCVRPGRSFCAALPPGMCVLFRPMPFPPSPIEPAPRAFGAGRPFTVHIKFLLDAKNFCLLSQKDML